MATSFARTARRLDKYVELVNEDLEAEGGILVFRFKSDKWWFTLMRDWMREASAEGKFGVEANKTFFLDPETEKLRFLWSITVWGDLEEAVESFGEIGRQVAYDVEQAAKAAAEVAKPRRRASAQAPSPPEPVKAAQSDDGKLHRLSKEHRRDQKGRKYEITRIKLPHYRQNAERWSANTEDTVTLSDRYDHKGRRRVNAGVKGIG